MEKNKIRIIYNPYKKTIKYERWHRDGNENIYKWKDLGSKSPLLQDEKYTKGTIQHNADGIIEEIIKEYSRGREVEIVFDGTEKDYVDFREVVKNSFSSKGVTCKEGDFYIDAPEEIMPEIKKVFNQLRKTFGAYETNETKTALDNYEEVTKLEIPICVVGTYSTGKSAFINALIGTEVLPSALNPTTACNYKITQSEKNGVIKFSIEEEKITIVYDDKGYKIEGKIDAELRKSIQTSLKENNCSSLTENMHYSLLAINQYAEQKIGLIEVEIPFYKGVLVSDKYKFVIYDTPGSDTASHKNHVQNLKKALAKQTNGLPIVLTKPDSMDRSSLKELIEMLKKIDGLDLPNVMVVVNQADDMGTDELEKKNGNGTTTILDNGNPNRLYYLSAIIGLGSKKNSYDKKEHWIDARYFKVFRDNRKYFIDVEEDDYKQLYKYNQMAPVRWNWYRSLIADKTDERNESELLYINSGLQCIEYEILDYVEKYALYNKCAHAQDYLKKVIKEVKEKASLCESKAEKLRSQVEKKQEKEKNKLLYKLGECIKEKSEVYGNGYPSHMAELTNTYYEQLDKKDDENKIRKVVYTQWEKVKESEIKNARVDSFLKNSKNDFAQIMNECKMQILERSKEYWKESKEKLQEECCDIIKGDESLSLVERKQLEEYIMKLDIQLENPKITVSAEAVSMHLINLFGHKRFKIDRLSKGRAIKQYAKLLKGYISRVNTDINQKHTDAFKEWSKKIKNGLIKKMAEFNPKLRELTKELDKYQEKIEVYQKQIGLLEKGQNKIEQMFEPKIKEDK